MLSRLNDKDLVQLKKRLVIFLTLQRAVQFFVGAATVAVLNFSGYSGLGAWIAVAATGFIYAYVSSKASFE
jgi:hypothetical protein